MGVPAVGIVGMRLGANFASVSCGLGRVDALVMWDPCPTGRSFLREQRTLYLLAGEGAHEDSAEDLDLPRLKLSAEMSNEISAVNLVSSQPGPVELGALAAKVLLLTRTEGAAARKLAERFDLPHVKLGVVTGQLELLDPNPPQRCIPAEGIATVAGWLDEVMPRRAHKIAMPTRGDVTVSITTGGRGTNVPHFEGEPERVRERAVSLGPNGLFGIETEPERGAAGPVCIFVSVANEHRVGPSRMWVDLSRRLAAEGGLRCVRFDVSGVGDSPCRDGAYAVHSVVAIDDVLDVAKAVSPDDPSDVVLFGLCSSGYHILEAALSLRPKGICSVNPSSSFQPPELAVGEMAGRRRFCLPGGVAGPGINRPGERVKDLVAAGTDVFLICGTREIQPFLSTGISSLCRAQGETGLRIEVIATLEHSLLPPADRDLVAGLILDHVLHHSGFLQR
jgi:pimeloyl-ACP methyl ester carboxylesterase